MALMNRAPGVSGNRWFQLMPMKRITFLTVLGTLVFSVRAAAQPAETDKSLAQSLFEQAKELMLVGNYDAACPKFAESQRLDPGGGTMLNLALCHEKQAKLATAWTEFKEALSAAKRDGRQDRILAAEEHIAKLESQLPWLTLNVAGPCEGQIVLLDGAPLGSAGWGVPVAIDPGSHELEVNAPGKRRWTEGFMISVAEKRIINIPQLEGAPEAPASIRSRGSALLSVVGGASPNNTSRMVAGTSRETLRDSETIGWIVGGAGVAALGLGTFFGVRTLVKKKQSDDECPTNTTCSGRGVELNNEANTAAWVANVGIALGLVGIGVGAFIVVSGGTDDEAKRATTGTRSLIARETKLSPNGGSVGLIGVW
jgi:hypothetical protein